MSCEKLQTFNLNLTRTVSETWHTAGPLQSGHDTVQTFNICHILRHTHLWCMKRKTFQKQWNRNETSGCIMSSFSEFCDKTTRSKKTGRNASQEIVLRYITVSVTRPGPTFMSSSMRGKLRSVVFPPIKVKQWEWNWWGPRSVLHTKSQQVFSMYSSSTPAVLLSYATKDIEEQISKKCSRNISES